MRPRRHLPASWCRSRRGSRCSRRVDRRLRANRLFFVSLATDTSPAATKGSRSSSSETPTGHDRHFWLRGRSSVRRVYNQGHELRLRDTTRGAMRPICLSPNCQHRGQRRRPAFERWTGRATRGIFVGARVCCRRLSEEGGGIRNKRAASRARRVPKDNAQPTTVRGGVLKCVARGLVLRTRRAIDALSYTRPATLSLKKLQSAARWRLHLGG